ncbi:MAG: glycosyltransferase family 2 protein [Bacteroidales bacterium]|nr:glycosyltransferase family 2 protein [Bacteroidales bacterium]
MTTVSLIVPIYKVEKYIEQCARSVLGQSWPSIQFIFVDDCSPDSSIDILEALIEREFASLKDRIQIIRKPVNEGLPQARKTGIAAATGDYILHVDADDWIEPDAVEKLALKAGETGADVVYFFAWKEFGDGRSRVITDKEFATPQDFADAVLVHDAHPSVVLKFWRRTLFSPEIFFPRYGQAEDMVQSLQLLDRAKKAVRLPEPLYHYRRSDSDAMSRSKRARKKSHQLRNYLDLYRFYRDSIETSPIRRTWRKILRKARLWALLYDRSAIKDYPELF